jgi:hypothetical protein
VGEGGKDRPREPRKVAQGSRRYAPWRSWRTRR